MGSTDVGEISIPLWLNAEFLEEILSENKKKNISLTDLVITPAVPKGDNYLSTLYRIIVECNESKAGNGVDKHYLILKTLPAGEMMQKILSSMNCFEKEMQMYGNTLPDMYRIMKDKSLIGNLRPLSARHFPTKMSSVILLEDLQHLGFRMANRHFGLDLEHSQATVRALARLHGASVALHRTDPTTMDLYSEGMYADNKWSREMMSRHLENNLSILASNIENWPGYEHFADKIRGLIPVALDNIIKSVKPNKGSLNVLNHGDCWVNNIMFHYCPNSGIVDDVRFIDFQITRFSSPALDLQYFLCTSLNDDIRFKKRDYLLSEYHAELKDTLMASDLDLDQFTLHQLKAEFKEKEMFGLISICTVLCAVLAESSDAPDFSELREDDPVKIGTPSPMDKALAGIRFREVFQTFLHHYERKGLL